MSKQPLGAQMRMYFPLWCSSSISVAWRTRFKYSNGIAGYCDFTSDTCSLLAAGRLAKTRKLECNDDNIACYSA